ncbi:hypothetical protein JNN96_33025 [Mycobacterium sp. DSM 3803]|nr:hypothetical protein [Mycobacterium sp. DSM 3803]
MTSQLPPSKFGAGTTYGETGQAYALPQATPPPAAMPPTNPVNPDNYAAAPAYLTHTPDPYATTQFASATAYSSPAPPGVAPTAIGSGGGAAIAAAVLSLIGALWYGIDVVRNWDTIGYLFQSLDGLSALGLSGSVVAWAYGAIAAVIAEFVFVVLLLLGAILLLARNSAGRVMVALGSLLVVAANVYWALAAFHAVDWLDALNDDAGIHGSTGEFAATILLNTGLPGVLALVTLILAMTAAAKRWCQRVPAVIP